MSKSTHVLYVEDDERSRLVMDLVFEDLDAFELTTFADSRDFAMRINNLGNTPNLFLLDIHVEPIGGFEMLEVIRANASFPSTPIVALTASVMNEEIAMLQDAGFDSVLGKPIDIATFEKQLLEILSGNKLWSVH